MSESQKNDPRLIEFARENRREQTSAEKIVWRRLRAWRESGIVWRRQHVVHPYILDFACFRAKVVLEIDGDTHADQEDYDLLRTRFLEKDGWLVIRMWNFQVNEGADLYFDELYRICESRMTPRRTPSPLGEGWDEGLSTKSPEGSE